MLWLKSCPRCRGDLQTESDRYGPYIACIQCGYHVGDAELAVLRGDGSGQQRLAAVAVRPGTARDPIEAAA